MKVNMEQLIGQEQEPVKKSPPNKGGGRMVKVFGVFALCLAALGGFAVYNQMSTKDNASADALYDESEINPSFTVQQMGLSDVPAVGEGAAEGNTIPVLQNKEGAWNVGTEDGLVKTEQKLTELYKEYETNWNKSHTLSGLSYLNGVDGKAAAGYRLSEIWIGKNKESKDQSDFSIVSVPQTKEGLADTGKVVFTNNPDGKVSGVENGWYKPDEDGSYTVCIKDGDVIRLLFDTMGAESSGKMNVYDYDVTDGSYYLNSDYYHKGDAQKTSGQGSRSGNLYVDGIGKGINQEGNYSGDGPKLGFGGSNIGSGLEDEARENELDTINVYNVVSTETTGVSLGLTKGIGTDGNLLWADGISVPNLFNGKAAGKFDYVEDKYSAGFKQFGFMRTLSSVKSAYGLELTGLEAVGKGMWLGDKLPSSGTDGHDIVWGDGSKSKKYYRDGDRSVKTLKDSDDKQNHNKFFGMTYVQDFTLSPGYIGPLDFFGYSDDDLWAYAARVDKNGKVMEDTAVCVADLGGVHDGTAYYSNLWDAIKPVEYGKEAQQWRLFVYWLERDGISAKCNISFSLPEAAISDVSEDTGSVTVEAAKYSEDNKGTRTFVFDDGTTNKYMASIKNGTSIVVTSGKEFNMGAGTSLSINGLEAGREFTIKETGKPYVWTSSGDTYGESDAVTGKVGETEKVSFLSVDNKGKITIGTNANETPEGGFIFSIDLEDVPSTGVMAVSTGDQKKLEMNGGRCSVAIGAGDSLTLYNLPEGAEFSVNAEDVSGYRVAEIIIDGDLTTSGKTVSGKADASVIYRYETGEETKYPKISMEQSVTGDWSTSQVAVKNGTPVSYNIKIENPYDTDMEVTVLDKVPEGLDVKEPVMSNGTVSEGVVKWNVKLEAKSSATVSFDGTVTSKMSGTFENKASVVKDGNTLAESNVVKAVIR